MEQYFLECDAQTNYFTNQVVSDITHLNSLYDANFNLRIFHLNIRSIGKNLDELKVVLSSPNHTYDIIVLTETWKIVDVNSFHMSDFDIIYNNGRVNQNDGVVIYIRSSLPYTHKIVDMAGKFRILQLDTSYDKTSISLLAVYRPHHF